MGRSQCVAGRCDNVARFHEIYIDESGVIDKWNEEYPCPVELLRDNLENARVSVASFITQGE
jgi:hypothetical protein